MYTDDPSIESDSIIDEYLFYSEAKKIEDEIKFSIGRAAVQYFIRRKKGYSKT